MESRGGEPAAGGPPISARQPGRGSCRSGAGLEGSASGGRQLGGRCWRPGPCMGFERTRTATRARVTSRGAGVRAGFAAGAAASRVLQGCGVFLPAVGGVLQPAASLLGDSQSACSWVVKRSGTPGDVRCRRRRTASAGAGRALQVSRIWLAAATPVADQVRRARTPSAGRRPLAVAFSSAAPPDVGADPVGQHVCVERSVLVAPTRTACAGLDLARLMTKHRSARLPQVSTTGRRRARCRPCALRRAAPAGISPAARPRRGAR